MVPVKLLPVLALYFASLTTHQSLVAHLVISPQTPYKSTLITLLRNRQTPIDNFRVAAHQLALILAQEASTYLPITRSTVITPLNAPYTHTTLDTNTNITLIPILRSGLALVPAFLQYYPYAKIGVIGLKRDEQTAIAHCYYKNIPHIPDDGYVIILDPMIATGGSALAVLNILTRMGVQQKQIIFVNFISATEGIAAIDNLYPNITVITADCDQILNQVKYIVPGLGDFGDRYFGTE